MDQQHAVAEAGWHIRQFSDPYVVDDAAEMCHPAMSFGSD
jgi:hypothetical protein